MRACISSNDQKKNSGDKWLFEAPHQCPLSMLAVEPANWATEFAPGPLVAALFAAFAWVEMQLQIGGSDAMLQVAEAGGS